MKTRFWIVLFFAFAVFNTVLFAGLTVFQLHQELDRTVQRTQEDIIYTDRKWDTTSYNADPLLPGGGPLYILSQDGYVIERWKPITGFLDASDFKHLLAFTTPQTIQTDTNQEWRVYSLPIQKDDQTIGVVTVSVYHPSKESLPSVDTEMQKTARRISEHVTVDETQIRVENFDQRNTAYYLSYQVVDKSNTLIFKSNNSNSIDRLPNFIDPSYVARELRAPGIRLIVDTQTKEVFLTKSEPLRTENNTTQGIIVSGRSMKSLLSVLVLQMLVQSALFLFILILGYFGIYLKRMREQQKKEKKLNVSFDPKESVIIINEKIISISFASNQYYLCDAVFSKKNKRWEIDELLEKFGEEITPSGWRTVYDATNQINKKTKEHLPAKLILADEKTYRFNPTFL